MQDPLIVSDRTGPPRAGPNILLIMSDTHQASASGCYGSNAVMTPNLDQLAQDGVVFEAAYCQNPLCLPSRQSLITGRYSFETGIKHNHTTMPAMYTMGHHFTQHGYETAAIGKMHFIPDTQCSGGRERHYGFMHRVDYEEFHRYLRDERRAPAVEDQEDDPWRIVHLEQAIHVLQRPLVRHPDGTGDSGVFAPGVCGHEDHQEALVIRAWDAFLTNRDCTKPFLAVVSFQSPHPPFLPTEECLRQYALKDIALPADPEGHVRGHPLLKHRLRCCDADGRKQYLRYYHAFISYMDACVGRVLHRLQSAGLEDDTMVVYCSDHGEMAHEHGMTDKLTFYEASVRVPLIIRYPGRVPKGRRYRGLVELIDVFPSICACCGLDPPEDRAGRSFFQDLLRGEDQGKRAVFSEIYPMPGRTEYFIGALPNRMVRTREYKLMEYGDTCMDLFDMQNDPGEVHNLSRLSGYQDLVRTLKAMVHERCGPLVANA